MVRRNRESSRTPYSGVCGSSTPCRTECKCFLGMERVLSVALDITAGTDDTGLRARLQPLPAQCEQAFVDTVLGTVPEIPDYYRRMKEVNSAGPILLSALPGGARLGMDEFEAKRQSLDATVVDLRRPEAFGGAHIPGSISIGAGPNLSSWAA